MRLECQGYLAQRAVWPASGRHILAQFDDRSIVVYQAYRPSIGRYAAEHGRFGEGFSFDRMSWIKPSFLWMMYRCGWATKQGQEVVLAVRVCREGFDRILSEAVHSTFVPGCYDSEATWRDAVARSHVRLQWDPDHDPYGGKVERRAIQLGLRGPALAAYGREWITSIEDVTDFVREQHELVRRKKLDELMTPKEEVYPVADGAVRARLGVAVP